MKEWEERTDCENLKNDGKSKDTKAENNGQVERRRPSMTENERIEKRNDSQEAICLDNEQIGLPSLFS